VAQLSISSGSQMAVGSKGARGLIHCDLVLMSNIGIVPQNYVHPHIFIYCVHINVANGFFKSDE